MGGASLAKNQEELSSEEVLKKAMSIPTAFDDKPTTIVNEESSSSQARTMEYKEEVGLEKEQDYTEDEVKMAEIRRMYRPEILKIAESFVDQVGKVLLGSESFVYTFTAEDCGVDGLEFSFRSLSANDENELKYTSRMNGWDVNPTGQSVDLFYYEQILASMVDYCGKRLVGMDNEKKRELVGRIPSFIMKRVFEKYSDFQAALDLVSKGKGELDLVKKSLAPRH